MKKIVLFPKTDTVIVCLPEEWVGIPIICKLTPMPDYFMNNDALEAEIEKRMRFHNRKRRKKKD